MFIRNKKLCVGCLSICLLLSIFIFVSTNSLAQQYAPAQHYPLAQQYAPAQNYPAAQQDAPANNLEAIKSWFYQYDQIRHTAQMSPAERQQADQILGKGLALFMPGNDKILAQRLLIDLVKRYDIACHELGGLQVIPATEQLHRGYYQYFSDAHHLFSDYLRLQDDLLAADPATGQPLASGLIDRKQALEQLDRCNKILDQQLRHQYGIPPYQY